MTSCYVSMVFYGTMQKQPFCQWQYGSTEADKLKHILIPKCCGADFTIKNLSHHSIHIHVCTVTTASQSYLSKTMLQNPSFLNKTVFTPRCD